MASMFKLAVNLLREESVINQSMFVSNVAVPGSALLALGWIVLDSFVGFSTQRYKSPEPLESQAKPNQYNEALQAIASVLERKPECVCNVRTEAVVGEKPECPTDSSVSFEQVVSELWVPVVFICLCSLCVGIWLGWQYGRRSAVCRCGSRFSRPEDLLADRPVRIDVDSLAAARRRAREISR